jgi:DNA-binding MarR family transcriptional regulator
MESSLTDNEYRDLAEFRHQIRRFLHFSETIARANSIEPQQHQLLLAVEGLPLGAKSTIREIADRLCIQHHSAVELVNRMEKAGTVVRRPVESDRREVRVEVTPEGRALLRSLTQTHREELERTGPALAAALETVLERARAGAGR